MQAKTTTKAIRKLYEKKKRTISPCAGSKEAGDKGQFVRVQVSDEYKH